MKKNKIPLSIISGFLGSGKTTFINKIINEFSDKKIGVIVNEFGEIPVETHLINNDEDQIVELNTACMCCMIRKDIITAAENLLAEHPDLDYLFVEVSGLSDPIPVAQTFIHNDLDGRIKLDTIINLIDSSSFMQNFSRFKIIAQQSRLANFVFLTKLDIAHERSIEFAQGFIQNLGKKTKAYELTENFSIKKFFDIIDLDLLDIESIKNDNQHHHHHHHHHEEDVDVINFQTESYFDLGKFINYCDNSLNDIIRAKGIIYSHPTSGDKEKYIFQAVADKKELIKQDITTQKNNKSILIVIGMSLDKELILNQLNNCLIE